MKFEFRILGATYTAWFSRRAQNRAFMCGATNKCKDSRYVIFLDYDNVPLEWIEEEIKFIQVDFDLGDFHLLKTKNGYHAICTDKVLLSRYVDILKKTSTDAAFKHVPMVSIRKVWTLRGTKKNGEKPFFIKTLKGGGLRQKSRAHNQYLRENFNIRISSKGEDRTKKIMFNVYAIN